MLYEYFRLLQATASRHARELGYVKESIAFEARAQRSWPDWQKHVQNCHEVILQQAEGLVASSAIWIIGSGHLLETPWQELLRRGHQLRLIDLYHPPRVKKWAKKYSGIELIEMDVTGFQNLSDLQKILLKVPTPPVLSCLPQDLMISNNIWSQLAILPVEHLERNTEINEEEKVQWARQLQRSHLLWLQGFRCHLLILSDFEAHFRNAQGQVTRIEEQAFRPHQLRKISSWDWPWAKNIIRKVEAYSSLAKTG